MEVLIVGAGAMGQWFGDVSAEVATHVYFLDIDETKSISAADRIGGRTITPESDRRFDLTCLAVPLSVTESLIAEYARFCDRAMIDVSGAMAGPIEAMRTHLPNKERVSLHPLFSAENAPGNIAIVADNDGPVTDTILEALERRGNTLVKTSPEEHDGAMETVQAKVHAAILAFALAADEVPAGLETPISRELTSLAEAVTSGNPRVYAEIQSRFAGARGIAEAAAVIASADQPEFERLYRQARDR